ncbi:hypothetical protein ACWGQ7_32180 [Streptomyces rochei]
MDRGSPLVEVRVLWRPVAPAAPCLRHRSGGPPPLSAQHAKAVDQARRKPDLPEHQDQADADHA